MLFYYSHNVTLTCQKSVLWVCGTTSKQYLCSLLHKTGEVFMESVNSPTDQKDKLFAFLMMHNTCQIPNKSSNYLTISDCKPPFEK